MPTLKAMFKLFDGYSTTIDKIMDKTDKATDKILNASGTTDKFNTKLQATGASAGKASSGLGKLIGTVVSLAAAQKGMSIVDDYINTSARLSLINDGLQTQAELQDKIFAAAERSRGVYSDMSKAISKMGILAEDAFGSDNELIAFTELIQKGFRVGGASPTEQSSAMLQLTQAMAAGRLQGDEFRSITENAPMIADAIAKYVGKSKGELREMSRDGEITADIIKNAMFASADDINAKFETLPTTFADVWNKIRNGALKTFEGVIGKVNKLINTEDFNTTVNGMIGGLAVIAGAIVNVIDVASRLGSFISDNWSMIEPIVWGIIGALIVYNGVAVVTNAIIGINTFMEHVSAVAKMRTTKATFAEIAAQEGLNAALYTCPITWIIIKFIALVAIFYIAIAAVNKFAGTSVSATGIIAGLFTTLAAHIYNTFIVNIWNAIAAFINFFANVFIDPVASIKILFYDLAQNVIGYILNMASAIEKVINKIPGVKVDMTSGLGSFYNQLEAASKKAKNESGWVEVVGTLDYMDYGKAWNKGYNWGKGAEDKVSSLAGLLTGKDFGKEFGTSSNPLAVEGTGKNGAVEVDMSDEDLSYLRDIAERDYINKFSTATLAPNIQVTFGDVHEEADANKVAGRIKKILQEEIATAAEGVYS